MFLLWLVTALPWAGLVGGLDNGLARLPPMGWLSWTKFLCETNCSRHPLGCISEQLYVDMADRLAEDGFLAAGYRLVNIDDCWMERSRDAQQRLVADRSRFPRGTLIFLPPPLIARSSFRFRHQVAGRIRESFISSSDSKCYIDTSCTRYVSDKNHSVHSQVHKKGLLLGIYEDFGTKTCMGYPGSLNYLEIDAQTFASWDVDMLKLDGCYASPSIMPAGGAKLWSILNPILYNQNFRLPENGAVLECYRSFDYLFLQLASL